MLMFCLDLKRLSNDNTTIESVMRNVLNEYDKSF